MFWGEHGVLLDCVGAKVGYYLQELTQVWLHYLWQQQFGRGRVQFLLPTKPCINLSGKSLICLVTFLPCLGLLHFPQLDDLLVHMDLPKGISQDAFLPWHHAAPWHHVVKPRGAIERLRSRRQTIDRPTDRRGCVWESIRKGISSQFSFGNFNPRP